MLDQTNANIERHIKTHSVRSDDDRAAVSALETFLRSNGRINTSFASNDKWPNHDGTFEFVPAPDISRRPQQTFSVGSYTHLVRPLKRDNLPSCKYQAYQGF